MPRSEASARRVLAAHPKAWLAVWMAWAAGFVDVVAWVVLDHIYASHMTGNTASFAQNLVAGKLTEAFHHGWPILPFLGGLLYSATSTKIARRRGIHSSFSIALISILVLLIAVVFTASPYMSPEGTLRLPTGWLYYLLIAMLAAAMGMQTVTVTNINGLRVYTTYLTGSLSKLAENSVDFLFWMYDRLRHRHPRRVVRVLRVTPRQKHLQNAALTAGLWIGFFTGGVCGAAAEGRFALYSLFAPIAILTIASMVDLLW